MQKILWSKQEGTALSLCRSVQVSRADGSLGGRRQAAGGRQVAGRWQSAGQAQMGAGGEGLTEQNRRGSSIYQLVALLRWSWSRSWSHVGVRCARPEETEPVRLPAEH